MCIVTPIAMAMNKALRDQCDATKNAQYSNVSHKVAIDTILTRSGTALCFTKLVMYVPILGWFMSQLYSLRFPRRKSAAESSRNGVVGSTGTNAPMIPNASDMRPRRVRIQAIRNVS